VGPRIDAWSTVAPTTDFAYMQAAINYQIYDNYCSWEKLAARRLDAYLGFCTDQHRLLKLFVGAAVRLILALVRL